MNIKIKRLIALLIDYVLIVLLVLIPYDYIWSMDINEIVKNILEILAFILIIVLLIRKDCLIGYESIGKKLMKLKIYKNGERVIDKKILVSRVVKSIWTMPLHPLWILIHNKSDGDDALGTEVK